MNSIVNNTKRLQRSVDKSIVLWTGSELRTEGARALASFLKSNRNTTVKSLILYGRNHWAFVWMELWDMINNCRYRRWIRRWISRSDWWSPEIQHNIVKVCCGMWINTNTNKSTMNGNEFFMTDNICGFTYYPIGELCEGLRTNQALTSLRIRGEI